MSVIDRFSKVVKAEWNHLVGKDGLRHDVHVDDSHPRSGTSIRDPVSPARIEDTTSALRVLELSGPVQLDEVRAQYQRLARRYHPKTTSEKADEAHAARVVLEALTEALEILEEDLLPLPK